MPATEQARDLAVRAAQAAADKLAQDILVLDVSERLVITDCFVIASASNERQVQAIVENVEEKLLAIGTKPVRREGTTEGRWVLLDYVDVVVHVQHVEERVFYGLERLWKDCPRVEFTDASAPAAESSDPADGAATTTESPATTAESAEATAESAEATAESAEAGRAQEDTA